MNYLQRDFMPELRAHRMERSASSSSVNLLEIRSAEGLSNLLEERWRNG